MDSISICGGVRLQGRVRIQGSKNAALPILAATLLTEGDNYIYNCPKISDVSAMQYLLKSLGCIIKIHSEHMLINSEKVMKDALPSEAVRGMRSSSYMLGALLSRNKEVVMEYPGGCVIGARPIDMHLEALKRMGACFEEENGLIYASVPNGFHGASIHFQKVSVGATENVILAAVLADGVTTIRGAAKEPEVMALCEYLCACGAFIEGAGTDCIIIHGVKKLKGTSYAIPADRIVAGTYLFAVLAAGGCVLLEKAPYEQMTAVLEVAESLGAVCQVFEEGLYVQASGELNNLEHLCTDVYPGFPTDLQSVLLATLVRVPGECLLEESIFENRFRVVQPLREMGAHIEVIDNCSVKVKGVEGLHGRQIEATELRGGAALVVAGLAAEGRTIVTGAKYIMRGYENICKDLRELGARVISV